MLVKNCIISTLSSCRQVNRILATKWNAQNCVFVRFPHNLVPHGERTFIMVKPDGVQRGLVGDIIKRFEFKGFKLVAIKMMHADEERLKIHYSHLVQKPFFPKILKYMSSGPVVPMVWEGLDAVMAGRAMLGETDPKDSRPGTIRGDYSLFIGRNVVHGSDSVETAKREIAHWFKDEELNDFTPCTEEWIYEEM